MAEPFYIRAQRRSHFRLRLAAETVATLSRSLVTYCFVSMSAGEKANNVPLAFAFGQVRRTCDAFIEDVLLRQIYLMLLRPVVVWRVHLNILCFRTIGVYQGWCQCTHVQRCGGYEGFFCPGNIEMKSSLGNLKWDTLALIGTFSTQVIISFRALMRCSLSKSIFFSIVNMEASAGGGRKGCAVVGR